MRQVIRKVVMPSCGIMFIVMFNTACHTTKQPNTLIDVNVSKTVNQEKPLGKWYKCNTCNETGRCTTCKGTGKVSGNTCKKCSGTGDCPNCYGQGGWRGEE